MEYGVGKLKHQNVTMFFQRDLDENDMDSALGESSYAHLFQV